MVILESILLNVVYFFRVLEKVYMKSITSKKAHLHVNDHHFGEVDINNDEMSASMLVPTLILTVGLIVLCLLNATIASMLWIFASFYFLGYVWGILFAH